MIKEKTVTRRKGGGEKENLLGGSENPNPAIKPVSEGALNGKINTAQHPQKGQLGGRKSGNSNPQLTPVLGGESGKLPVIRSTPNNEKKSNVKSWAVPLASAAVTVLALMTIFFVAFDLMLALGAPIGVLGAVLTVARAIFLRDKNEVDLSGPAKTGLKT